eukprot:m.172612 g.172612  ORF g.172612 m.172612 type:complete len:374 (-) comp17860_c0_seq1:277-1398(-)
MGNAESQLEVPGGGSEGYHVLKVQDNSPGSKAGLESFFDFIIAVNGVRMSEDNEYLKTVSSQNIDKPIKLSVYSAKDHTVRDVSLTPSNTWGGMGLLGVSIRFCSFEGASENVWHVLDVHPNSPAAQAGLRGGSDYIVAADSLLDDRDDLYALIEKFNMKPLRLYVYNAEDDRCRDVTITPNDAWGGDGSLGCGIGYGYLHRIPRRDPAQRKVDPIPTPALKTGTDGFAEVPLVAPIQTPTLNAAVPVVPAVVPTPAPLSAPTEQATTKPAAAVAPTPVASSSLEQQQAEIRAQQEALRQEQERLRAARQALEASSPQQAVPVLTQSLQDMSMPGVPTPDVPAASPAPTPVQAAQTDPPATLTQVPLTPASAQ